MSHNTEKAIDASSKEEAERLVLLYQENAKVLAIFLEWRHKVMTHWFAVTGAAFAAAGWLYQQPAGRSWLSAPFLLGAFFSTLSALLDRRNVQILDECYRIGSKLERRIVGDGAIMDFIRVTHTRGITYTRVLRFAYWGVALLFLLLSILIVVFGDDVALTTSTSRP